MQKKFKADTDLLLKTLDAVNTGIGVINEAGNFIYVNEKYEFLDPWPAPDFGASQWYIRLRSKIIFRENGTYMISTRFPFTHLDKTFDNE